MRKFKFSLSFFLILIVCQINTAQLYVNNSYVYVADKYLYVKQDVNLQTTGNLYLRNQSQLLQGTAGSSTNQGAGKLAVFQEGSVNNFSYNYWCSPVGNASAASGNESFGVTMLNRPTTNILSTPATVLGSPTLDGFTNNSSLIISSRWIFKYLNSNIYNGWLSVGAASTLLPGEGFTMKGSSGTDSFFAENGVNNNPGSRQRYDFRGKPNDGNITIGVALGRRTLTGNPYPSAIDLKAFLVSATNSTGIAYFWEQDKTTSSHILANYRGGYGSYSPVGGLFVAPYGTMGIYTPAIFYAYDAAGTQLGMTGLGSNYERRFCPIGQGFLIEGSATGTVTMSNSFRVYQKEGAANYSQFERVTTNSNPSTADAGFLPEIPSVSGFDYTTVSTAQIPQIRFNALLNNQAVRQVALTFHPAATDGADFAMDAKSPDTAEMDMYFVIDNNEYVIDVIDFNVNKRIPIGFKSATPATFKIAVGDIINFEGAENVYIYDSETNIYYDIKNGEYEMSLPSGVNNTRYEITFLNATLSTPSLSSDSFDILQNNISQTLTIANPNLIDMKSIRLFDISGKLIFDKVNLGSKESYQFSTAGISDAVYVVKILTNNEQDFAKKITVYNGK